MYELVYIVSYDNHPLLSLLTVVDGRDVVYLESALTGRNTFGTFLGGNGTENMARRVSSRQL